MKYLKFTLILFIVSLCASCAQIEYDIFGTLAGQVIEVSTGEPLSNVSVLLSPGGKNTYTGSDGSFEFQELDPQQYTIMVQKEGYQTNRKTINLLAGETNTVMITMEKIQ